MPWCNSPHTVSWPVKDTPDGMIPEHNLARVNTAIRSLSESYYFARDLLCCPFE